MNTKIVVAKGFLHYYVKLVSGNGEVLMHSENYYNKSNARYAGRRLAISLKLDYKEEF